QRPLVGTVDRAATTAGDPQRGRNLRAGRRASRRRRRVRYASVTLLIAIDDAVAACLRMACRRAAVAPLRVAVVAGPTHTDRAVAARRGAGRAIELQRVAGHDVAADVLGAEIEAPASFPRAMRHDQRERRSAMVELIIRRAGEQDRRPLLHGD